MTDHMVLKTQQWLNTTYGDKTGFGSVEENGHTGWDTIYGLIRALQIELGITATANNFGSGTQSRFVNRWPNGISQTDTESNVHGIIQGALWCKGYPAEYGDITKKYTDNMVESIAELKTDIGLSDRSSTIDLELMMALLSMKQFKLLSTYGGKAAIRTAQQSINRQYKNYTGIVPTDGLYGREMNKALIQVLQSLEGFTPSEATGNFGNGTRSRLRTVSSGTSQWVWLASVALVCNGYQITTSNSWSSTITNIIRQFQTDYALPITGVVDPTTWMSLLTSKGNPDRPARACDCATVLNQQQAKDLRAAGYTHVGRYLTGTVGANHVSKAMSIQELDHIENAGLAVFPIYQDGGYYSDYFASSKQGIVDALTAIEAAKRLGFPSGTTIYFAVDFDAYGFQIDSLVLPYFQQVAGVFHSQKNPRNYRVGVYGPRLVCTEVSNRGYASSSFVADMSTGFSGNLGYPIPDNWAFDQFHEFTFNSSPAFPLDKDAYSGRDRGINQFDPVPEYTTEDLERLNLETRVESAKQAFIRYVVEPLGFYSSFVNIGWEYGKSVQVGHFSSGAFDVDVTVTVSETASSTSGWFGTVNIAVDNSGALTAETANQIYGSSAKFDIENLGSNLDFAQRLTSIATSVKAGTVSYRTVLTDSGQVVLEIKTESDNLAPQDSGIEASVNVTVAYILTPRSPNFNFQMPEIDAEKVLVGVGVVAVIALFVLTPVDEIGAAGAAVLQGLRFLGVVA